MSDRLSPGPEAKARFQALDEKDFGAFFDEISPTAMRKVAKYLPSVDGFRKTSHAGIAKQKVALARKLTKGTAGDRDFHGLYLIWRTWIDANFENSKTIHEAMDKLEKAVDKITNAEDRRLLIQQNADSFLRKLNDESLQNRCTREQIERLFTFSPLPETSASPGLITSAKRAADVERDATLSELPKRLKIDEDEIEQIKSELKSLSDRVEKTNASVQPFATELDRLQASIAEAKSSALAAHDAVETLAKVGQEVDANSTVPRPDSAPIEIRIEALAIALQSQRAEIRNLEEKFKDVDTLLDAITEVSQAQNGTDFKLKGQDQQIAELGLEFERVTSKVAEHDLRIDEKLGAIEDRLKELEFPSEVLMPSPAQPYEIKNQIVTSHTERRPHTSVGLRWDSLIPSDAIDTTILQSHTDLSRGIAGTLQALGLRNSSAKIFGEECAAAIIAKQAIFLKGSFATQTARAIARVIGGASSIRVAMPVGLRDGEELRATVEDAFGAERPTMSALVIEGINRTALDITREVLCDCLDPGFDRAPDRSVIIATISEGVASIPLELGYCDIGPVFDLNCLDWRTGQSPRAAGGLSALSSNTDRLLFTQIQNASTDTEEASRLANAFVMRRDPSIERAFVRAYRALHLVRTEVTTITPLQSLLYGWLMPYWLTLGVTKEQIEIELDGGKVNGTAVDPRLLAAFRAGGLS